MPKREVAVRGMQIGVLRTAFVLSLLSVSVAQADDAAIQAVKIANSHERAILLKHYDGGNQAESKVLQFARSNDGRTVMVKMELTWQGSLSGTRYAARGWLEVKNGRWSWDEKWISNAVKEYRLKKAIARGLAKGFRESSKRRDASRSQPARPTTGVARLRLGSAPKRDWSGWAPNASHRFGTDQLRFTFRTFAVPGAALPAMAEIRRAVGAINDARTVRVTPYQTGLLSNQGLIIKAINLTKKRQAAVAVYHAPNGAWYSCHSTSTGWHALGTNPAKATWSILGTLTMARSKTKANTIDWDCKLPVVDDKTAPVKRNTVVSWPVAPLLSGAEKWYYPLGASRAAVMDTFRMAIREGKLTMPKILAVHARHLSCYPDGILCDIRAKRNGTLGSYFLVISGKEYLLLNGDARGTHALNAKVGLQLRDKRQVSEYLQILCGGLRSKDGTYRLLTGADDLRWQSGTTAPQKLAAQMLATPMVISRDPKVGWRIDAVMRTRDTLYRAKLELSLRGSPKMVGERVLVSSDRLAGEQYVQSMLVAAVPGK